MPAITRLQPNVPLQAPPEATATTPMANAARAAASAIPMARRSSPKPAGRATGLTRAVWLSIGVEHMHYSRPLL